MQQERYVAGGESQVLADDRTAEARDPGTQRKDKAPEDHSEVAFQGTRVQLHQPG